MQHKTSATLRPFDIRCFGLISNVDFSIGTTFPSLWKILLSQNVISSLEEENGLICLVWQFGKRERIKRTVWFDPNRGYSPVRMELRNGDLTSDPVAISEVTWTEISGAWVPQTMTVKSLTPYPEEVSWNVEWESVNASIDGKIFTPEGFDLIGGAELLSDELGTIVKLGDLGQDKIKAHSKEHLTESSRPDPLRTGSIVFSFILLATVAILYMRRMRGKN